MVAISVAHDLAQTGAVDVGNRIGKIHPAVRRDRVGGSEVRDRDLVRHDPAHAPAPVLHDRGLGCQRARQEEEEGEEEPSFESIHKKIKMHIKQKEKEIVSLEDDEE